MYKVIFDIELVLLEIREGGRWGKGGGVKLTHPEESTIKKPSLMARKRETNFKELWKKKYNILGTTFSA